MSLNPKTQLLGNCVCVCFFFVFDTKCVVPRMIRLLEDEGSPLPLNQGTRGAASRPPSRVAHFLPKVVSSCPVGT